MLQSIPKGLMSEKEYKNNISGAKIFHGHSNGLEGQFWGGYLRGARRHYHGEIYGTDDEHTHWMMLLTSKISEQHRFRGLGYQCGFSGINLSDAMTQFEQADTRSMAIAAFCSDHSEETTI